MQYENSRRREPPSAFHYGLSTKELIGINNITDYSLSTKHGDLIFFIIKPTNISVLPDASVNSLIKRIDVYRSYRVHVEFNIDFDQFQFGLDLNRKEEMTA